jgi:hypothetical protein
MTACPNCGSPVPGDAKECGDCGRLFGAELFSPPLTASAGESTADLKTSATSDTESQAMPSAETSLVFDKTLLILALSRWDIRELPGGGAILTRDGVRGRDDIPAAWIIRLGFPLFVMTLYFLRGNIGNAAARPMVFWSGLGLLFVVCLAGIVSVFFKREEIRVRRGSIEKTTSLPGYAWTQRIDGMAVLRILSTEMTSRSRSHQIRRLRAENLGKKMILDEVSQTLDFALSKFMGMGILPDTRPDEMTALAKYLSHLTGWPIIDPQKGVF